MLDCKFDTVTQVAQIENLIAQKVDLIWVMPNDPLALIPAIKKAQDPGIPVEAVHSRIDPSGDKYTIGFPAAIT